MTRKPKILVVDDDPAVAQTLCDMLEHLGAETVALHASAAAERTETERFDAIVTDLHMPFLGGLELARRVRASKVNAGACVAVITGTPLPNLEKESLAAGADFFLEKPTTLTTLGKLVKAVQARSSKRELISSPD